MGPFYLLAERVGFEPTVQQAVHLISSQAHSTTLAPLRLLNLILMGAFGASTPDLIPRVARHPSGAPGSRVRPNWRAS